MGWRCNQYIKVIPLFFRGVQSYVMGGDYTSFCGKTWPFGQKKRNNNYL